LRRRRILLVGPLLPDEKAVDVGGIQVFVKNFLRSDIAEDHDIFCVNTSGNRPRRARGKLDLANVVLFLGQLSVFCLSLLLRWPDVVQIETSRRKGFFKHSVFVLISKVLRRRTVVSLHSGYFQQFYEEELGPLGRRYVRAILSWSDAVRVLSSGWAKFFVEKLGLPQTRIVPIPNFLDLEAFDAIPPRNRPNGTSLTVLFVGSVGTDKGAFDLLRAAELLMRTGIDFRLIIVGPEQEKGALARAKEIVEKAGLQERTQLAGARDHDETLGYYGCSDIFVLPSRFEGLPYCILEALAAGLPVVSTNVGAIPEVIAEGENGFLVTPGDVECLAERLRTLLTDRHLRASMGQANRLKAITDFSLAAGASRFRALYEKIA
jgi:glycosyltransferase involved in cell wall biosynthesis